MVNCARCGSDWCERVSVELMVFDEMNEWGRYGTDWQNGRARELCACARVEHKMCVMRGVRIRSKVVGPAIDPKQRLRMEGFAMEDFVRIEFFALLMTQYGLNIMELSPSLSSLFECPINKWNTDPVQSMSERVCMENMLVSYITQQEKKRKWSARHSKLNGRCDVVSLPYFNILWNKLSWKDCSRIVFIVIVRNQSTGECWRRPVLLLSVYMRECNIKFLLRKIDFFFYWLILILLSKWRPK